MSKVDISNKKNIILLLILNAACLIRFLRRSAVERKVDKDYDKM